MNFDDNLKKIFIKALETKLPPFDKFVSKVELAEWDPGVKSRQKNIEELAEKYKKTEHSLLIPVIGDIGSGKTHFLWEVKNSFDVREFSAFIDLPRSKERFYYNIYSDIIEEFGTDRVREFTQDFGEVYGAAERLYGFFRTQNIAKIALNAFDQLKEDYESLSSLQQCIIVLIQHFLKRDTYDITERWLLGQIMDLDELFVINVNEDLTGKNMAKTMLKLLLEHYSDGIIVLFDDYGKAVSEYEKLMDYSDCDSVNWANDITDDIENSNQCTEYDNLHSLIAYLLNHIQKFKMIITIDKDISETTIEELKKYIPEEYISEPIYLRSLNQNDADYLYFTRIKGFCWDHNLKHPAADRNFDPRTNLNEYYEKYGEDLYFPLNREIVRSVHELSNGNARNILRNFKRIMDSIIFEEATIDSIDEDYTRFIRYT